MYNIANTFSGIYAFAIIQIPVDVWKTDFDTERVTSSALGVVLCGSFILKLVCESCVYKTVIILCSHTFISCTKQGQVMNIYVFVTLFHYL